MLPDGHFLGQGWGGAGAGRCGFRRHIRVADSGFGGRVPGVGRGPGCLLVRVRGGFSGRGRVPGAHGVGRAPGGVCQCGVVSRGPAAPVGRDVGWGSAREVLVRSGGRVARGQGAEDRFLGRARGAGGCSCGPGRVSGGVCRCGWSLSGLAWCGAGARRVPSGWVGSGTPLGVTWGRARVVVDAAGGCVRCGGVSGAWCVGGALKSLPGEGAGAGRGLGRVSGGVCRCGSCLRGPEGRVLRGGVGSGTRLA
ncbi:hypothetical protein SCANM124S_05884 [Streptomyces canus]